MTDATTMQNACNATIERMVARLPDKPLLSAQEVADAIFHARPDAVVAAIDEGRLAAARVGRRYRISRTEAERWIRSLEASK